MRLSSVPLRKSAATLSIFCDLSVHSGTELIGANFAAIYFSSLLVAMLPNAGTTFDEGATVGTGMTLASSSARELTPSLIFSMGLIF